jgi:hypothetical protein
MAKVQLTGGSFEDSEGNALALGYLEMQLSQDENVSGVGQICAGITITIQLDASGNVVVSPVQSVWGNDVMLPVNSYYRVTGWTAAGQMVFGPNNQQVTGASPFNLSTWIPNQIISWTPSLQAPAITVNGTPLSSQTALAFTSTDNSVAITNPSGGTVNLQAVIPTLSSIFDNVHGFSCAAGVGSGFPATGMTLYSGSSVVAGAATATNLASYRPSSSGANYFVDTGNGLTLGALSRLWTRYTLQRTTQMRAYIGIALTASVQGGALASNTPSTDFLGFRYSTSAGDTHWQCYASPTGISPTIVATTVVPDTNFHVFQIVMTAGVATFFIDGVLVGTISTNAPSTSLPQSPVLYAESLDASPTYFGVSYLWWTGN